MKNIADTIDWTHVAPQYKWMARDDDGYVYLFGSKPITSGLVWATNRSVLARSAEIFASYRRGTCGWRDSLVQRPEGV